jgi:hypothetical protein
LGGLDRPDGNVESVRPRIATQSELESMAMRDLVTGGAACAVPGSSSSSNPLGTLANALIGSSSKIEVLFYF